MEKKEKQSENTHITPALFKLNHFQNQINPVSIAVGCLSEFK